jgi:galactose oxidase-like protein
VSGLALDLSIRIPMSRMRRALACTALVVAALLPALPASAHGPASGRPVDEKRVRALEVRTLGSAHAREHAVARGAARRQLKRWRALPASKRRQIRDAARHRLHAAASEPASEVGRWDTPFALPVHAVHSAILPTGKVMFWSYPFRASESAAREVEGRAWLWDPAEGTGAGAFEQISPPSSNGAPHALIFCSGGSLLSNGSVLIAGGTLKYPSATNGWAGIKDVWTFDPWTETWTKQPDTRQGRWYPSQELLPDGRTLILGGYDESGDETNNKDLEVFTPSPDPTGVGTIERFASGDRSTAFYPHLFTMPTGQVLLGGPSGPDAAVLDTSTFQWTELPEAAWRNAGTAILEPAGPAGSMRVTQIGGTNPLAKDPVTGAQPARSSSETFDLTTPLADWQLGSSMNIPRSNFNSVLLPDGSVAAVGGSNGVNPDEANYATWPDSRSRQIEIRDPATGQWRLGPAQAEDRAYHSTAVLLPDGRVLSGGDDRPGGRTTDTGEIYSPPYLFRGPRPVVDSAPAEVRWGRAMRVDVSGPHAERVVLMAPGVTTHGAEMQAKHVELAIAARDDDGVIAVAPPTANVAQPGWYMLFALSADGVPSVARWVHVHAAAPDTGPPPLPPVLPVPPVDPPGTPPVDPGPTPPVDPPLTPPVDPPVTPPADPPVPGFGSATRVTIGAAALPVRSGAVVATLANANAFGVPARLTLGLAGTRAAGALAANATVPGNGSRRIKLRLSSSQLALVRRRRNVIATLTAVVRDPKGTQRSVRRTVRLVLR